MTQEWFLYSFVARGSSILADHKTEFCGNSSDVALQFLHNLPASSNHKSSYVRDHYSFNFDMENGYTFCVVAKEGIGKELCAAVLGRIKEDFSKRYGGGKADSAAVKSLTKEFGPVIKGHMQYVAGHAEEIDKVLNLKAKVSEVQNIMKENIDKAIKRGEDLTITIGKAEGLRDSAHEFQKRGTQVRRLMWYQNMKTKLVVLAVLVILVLVIVASICHGFNCTK